MARTAKPSPLSVHGASAGDRRLLQWSQVRHGTSLEIHLDRADHIFGRDQIHAPGQCPYKVYAAMLGQILLIAIAKGNRP